MKDYFYSFLLPLLVFALGQGRLNGEVLFNSNNDDSTTVQQINSIPVDFAQGFQIGPVGDYFLTDVQLGLDVSSGGGGIIGLELLGDSGGLPDPSNIIAATSLFPNLNEPLMYQVLTSTLTGPVILSSGVDYWLRAFAVNANTGWDTSISSSVGTNNGVAAFFNGWQSNGSIALDLTVNGVLVPEPGTYLLLGSALAVCAIRRKAVSTVIS